jgi:hypothetical protein
MVWLVAFATYVYFKVWGEPVCFAVYTISWPTKVPDAHAAVIDRLNSDGLEGKTLCGLDGGNDLVDLI